jgi:hypothetical protein
MATAGPQAAATAQAAAAAGRARPLVEEEEPFDAFRSGWELVSRILQEARTPGHALDEAANLTAPTLRALCQHLGYAHESARPEADRSHPPRGRGNRASSDSRHAGVLVQLCNQASVAEQVWPSLLAFVVAQRGSSSRAIWRAVQALLHTSARAAEVLARGGTLEEAGLATDVSGVFAPRPASLNTLFSDGVRHSGGDALPGGLFEQSDPSAPPAPGLVEKKSLGATSTLWQVEKELSRLREALELIRPSLDSSDGLLASHGLLGDPHATAEFLLGMSEACVTAAAVATTPTGDASVSAHVPAGAVAALLRLQVAAGHGDRAEASLSRAHDAGMLLAMRHYEPVMRLRASERRLGSVIGLLLSLHERGVTSNSDVGDDAYAVAFRSVSLALEAGEHEGVPEVQLPAASPSEDVSLRLRHVTEACTRVDESGGSLLTPTEAEALATALLNHAAQQITHPAPVLLAEVERLFSTASMRERGWRLARSEITHSGECPASGRHLSRRALAGAPLVDAISLIRQVIDEHESAQHAKDAGFRGRSKAKPAPSLRAVLEKRLIDHGPFDLVIDGANLGLFRRAMPGGYLSYFQLDALVQHAQAAGLKPLVVLHKRWMRPLDLVPDIGDPEGGTSQELEARRSGRDEMAAVIARWKRDCPESLIMVPRGNDDVYWMYAALQSQRMKLRVAALEQTQPGYQPSAADFAAIVRDDSSEEDERAARALQDSTDVLSPHRSVWLVTNDFMRDHKGELLGWHNFGAWRAGIVKAILDRHPRWYARGADTFDEFVHEIEVSASSLGSPDAAAAAAAAANAAAAPADDVDEEGDDLALRGIAKTRLLRRAAEAKVRRTLGGLASPQSHDSSLSAPSTSSVKSLEQITDGFAALAPDQLRRGIWFVLPHPYTLRFHSPDHKSVFFFPGFDRSVDERGGVPDIVQEVVRADQRQALPRGQRKTKQRLGRGHGMTLDESGVSVDAAFEATVRTSSFVPLWKVCGDGESLPHELPPLSRWVEDRPVHPRARVVLPPPRPWFVLYNEKDTTPAV